MESSLQKTCFTPYRLGIGSAQRLFGHHDHVAGRPGYLSAIFAEEFYAPLVAVHRDPQVHVGPRAVFRLIGIFADMEDSFKEDLFPPREVPEAETAC